MELSSGDSPPLLRVTVIFAVGGATPAEAVNRAKQLQALYRRRELALQRPVGGQEQLWRAMLPGYPAQPAAFAYRQFLLVRDLAAAQPFGSDDAGDDTGWPLLYSTDAGTLRVVLLDIAQALREGRSASIGIVGDSGGGKSYLSKALSGTPSPPACR
jgi:hypothetical protein